MISIGNERSAGKPDRKPLERLVGRPDKRMHERLVERLDGRPYGKLHVRSHVRLPYIGNNGRNFERR